MNPVVGLDVAKGESQVQAFLEKKKPYQGSFKVTHTIEGLETLFHFLREIENRTGIKPPIVLESTGHYHTPVVQYFEERGYLLIIVNPLISYRAKSSSLRKVKTDIIDARHLCELYYKEDLEPYKKRGIQLLNLRNLSRQHANITGIYVQTKLQFQAVLDQVFPEYKGVFGDLYSVVSLLTLLEFPTSEIGEIDRFNHPKKLVAFAGIDPSIFESGKFKGTVNRITKRGSGRLRHALYMAVRCAIRDCRKKKTTDEIIPRNKRLREFYDKKREEGKPFKVAVIACANKLLQWIYALLQNNSTFQDLT
ncbi:IS110 family transposase [Peribacillus butanolivorans]